MFYLTRHSAKRKTRQQHHSKSQCLQTYISQINTKFYVTFIYYFIIIYIFIVIYLFI